MKKKPNLPNLIPFVFIYSAVLALTNSGEKKIYYVLLIISFQGQQMLQPQKSYETSLKQALSEAKKMIKKGAKKPQNDCKINYVHSVQYVYIYGI